MKEAVILIGKPWSGKNTIGDRLSREYGYAVVESGKMSRGLAINDPEIRQTVARGEQIPLYISHKCIEDALRLVDSQKVVINGYPRHPDNAIRLQVLLSELGYERQSVVSLNIPDSVALDRFRNDQERDGRSDNRLDSLLNRLASYRLSEVSQVEQYYERQGVLRRVNGDKPSEIVFREIVTTLKN